MAAPRVAVVGSINMDLVIRCRQLPAPGQTVLAQESREVCGGKGANQAVAASRAGGQVSMVGRIGSDSFANRLLENLRAESINVDHVSRSDGPSGVAVVAVDDESENSILVVPGANGLVTPADVTAAQSLLIASDVVLIQLEVPVPAVLKTLAICQQAGVRTILDPAPAPLGDWPDELLDVDLLCPNESEAAAICAAPCGTLQEATLAAQILCDRGAKRATVTMGAQGTLFFDGSNSNHIASYQVAPVDTTAAGDAFAGALAVEWARTGDLMSAHRYANAAGALATTRVGAQAGLPRRAEIEQLMRQ